MAKAPTEGPGSRGTTVEWRLNQPPEYVIELWGVDATIEAILSALAHKNDKFMEEVQRLLKAQDKFKKKD